MFKGPNKKTYVVGFVVTAMVISFTMLPKQYSSDLFKHIHTAEDDGTTAVAATHANNYSTENKEETNDKDVVAQDLDQKHEVEVDAVPLDAVQNKKNTPKINNVIPEGSDLL